MLVWMDQHLFIHCPPEGHLFFFSFWKLLSNIVLVSAIHQHESVPGIHMSAPSWMPLPSPTPSRPSRLSQGIRLTSPGHTANSHMLSILHTVVCMFPHYSLSSSHPLLPLLWPQVHSLCLHLHCCPADRFLNTIFPDSIHMCQHTVFVFLFLTYFTLYNRL